MEAIVRKEEERAASNKQSDFRLRGRPVNPEKITRYIKEHPELAASANDMVDVMVDVDGAITSAGAFTLKRLPMSITRVCLT
jgi:hypothetical protein